MHLALKIFANRSLAFHLYDFHLDGISAKELATAHCLPAHCVEERIEAVRLCLKFQVTVTVGTKTALDQLAA
jgi:hypothetical protein